MTEKDGDISRATVGIRRGERVRAMPRASSKSSLNLADVPSCPSPTILSSSALLRDPILSVRWAFHGCAGEADSLAESDA